ncbi:MAG: branched-chain amino acid ABC transporter substrate-binding protein [Pseudomonadota bacterium]
MKLKITSVLVVISLVVGTSSATADVIKVGFIGPISGKLAANGIAGRNSAELAVQIRNADSHTQHKYELVALDDECKPNIGVQVATKMAADKDIVATIGHFCSAVATGAVDIYHKFGLPIVVWGAIAPAITYGNDYGEVFRTIGTLTSQNETAIKFMESRGYKRVVMIHDTTAYGAGHQEAFATFAQTSGVDLVESIGVTADQQDFTAELTKVKSHNADVIYFGGLVDLGIRVRNQMDKVGVDAQFVGVSGIIADTFIEGAVNAEGSIAMRQGAPVEDMPGGPKYLKLYEEAQFDNPPEAYGIYAFTAMNVLLDAIEKAGSDREAIKDTLAGLPEKDYAIGPVRFDSSGQNTFSLITPVVVKDGKWVKVE